MKPNNERPAETAADSSIDADVTSVSRHSSKPPVVRSPLSVRELRVGNYLMNAGVMVKIEARSIFDIWEETLDYEPVPLTESLMLRFRRFISDERQPMEFTKHEPTRQQGKEYRYYSKWINEDYQLEFCPSFDRDNDVPKFWFCWYHGSSWFLPLKQIRGENTLTSVYQLQNLFYALTGYDLVLR